MSISMETVLFIWSLGLLFIMIKTGKFKIGTFVSDIVLFSSVLTFLHALFGEIYCMYWIMAFLTYSVWRLILCKKHKIKCQTPCGDMR